VLTTTGFNLLLYSEQFDNDWWFKSRATATANVIVSPDGTVDADKLTENTAASNTHYIATTQYSTVSGTSYTWSVYLKAGERTKARVALQMFFTGSAYPTTNPRVNVDLTTGTLSGANGTIATSITNAGNGWYRVTVSATANANAADQLAGVFLLDDAGNQTYTGDGTSGLFIWGAQLETGLTATSYIPTQAATSGAPRFDYNPTTLAPLGLLIEEQRTNLLTYSEQFDNAVWTKTRSSITADATTSPDGTVDADKLVEDTTASSTHVVFQSVVFPASGTVTATIYAKAAERNFVLLSRGTLNSCGVNLTTGQIVGVSGTNTTATTQNVGNGWWRVSLVFPSPNITTTINIYPSLDGVFTNRDYTGDGVSGIYIWGAQLEAGAFPTSYIQTVASQVTRSADVAVMTGTNFSDWYNAAEGALFCEGSREYLAATTGLVQIDDGTNSNRIAFQTTNTAKIRVFIVSGGVTQATIDSAASLISNVVFKTALGYATNDVSGALNGVSLATDTSATIPTVSTMRIGQGLTPLGAGRIQRIAYYPRRLANSELQAITA
jgi:hypothetical protein